MGQMGCAEGLSAARGLTTRGRREGKQSRLMEGKNHFALRRASAQVVVFMAFVCSVATCGGLVGDSARALRGSAVSLSMPATPDIFVWSLKL
jgi:hypothetical protein